MTSAFEAISEHVFIGKADRAESRAIAHAELERMSKAMVEEKGLLNHAQAADVLGVSVKRVWELVRLGKLRRFDFAGRTYVSWTEVCKRYDNEIAAGERMKEHFGKRLVAGVKAATKCDEAQRKLGGYAGAYHEDRTAKKREKMKQQDEAFKAKAKKVFKELVAIKAPTKKKANNESAN